MRDDAYANEPWFNGMVLYQIYPRSFQDDNGDGVGDLAGIRRRLGYLKDLGVDCLWLNPFYPSPMKDFGYDIVDYCNVDPVFGSLTDFDELLQTAHELKIRVLIDLVPNHSSDQHPWFRESQQSRENPKSDWYIWRDGKPDGSPPNNWLSRFGGPVWQWSEPRRQYYLHSFLAEQPDLNWENPAVRQAMAAVMRFWLDKGVDGFRTDAIDFMGKDASYADEPANPDFLPDQLPYYSLKHTLTRDVGNFFDYLRFMADVVASYPDRLLILESFILERHKPELYWQFYRQINKPFCLPFNFELIFMEWSAAEIQSFIDDFQAGLRPADYPIYVLGNHDQARFASKVGGAAVRAGAMLLLTLPGISLIYYGEELGLSDVPVPEHLRTDPDGRDKSRTPMQWSPETNAGFSKSEPWLPVAPDYASENARTQADRPDSMLNLYKQLIGLRRHNQALRYGSYRPGPAIDSTVSFFRATDHKKLMIIINTSGGRVETALPAQDYRLTLSTQLDRVRFDGRLAPNEGVVLECL